MPTVSSRNRNFWSSWQKLSLFLLLEYILQNHGVGSTSRTVTLAQFFEYKTFSWCMLYTKYVLFLCYLRKKNVCIFFHRKVISRWLELARHSILQSPAGNLFSDFLQPLALNNNCSQVLCGNALLKTFLAFTESHPWQCKSVCTFTKVGLHHWIFWKFSEWLLYTTPTDSCILTLNRKFVTALMLFERDCLNKSKLVTRLKNIVYLLNVN